MDMSAAAGAVCTAGFPLPLWCKDNQIYNAEGLNSLRDQNWLCRLVVGQNQGHTAERSQERPALCHRWIVSADKRCSQKVSKAHQILQGPTELKQSSRNNTCTPIAMNDPWRHMDLAGGDCGSVPMFVSVTLPECLWNTYWLLISVPIPQQREPTVNGIGLVSEKHRKHPEEDTALVLHGRAQKIHIQTQWHHPQAFFQSFCTAGLCSTATLLAPNSPAITASLTASNSRCLCHLPLKQTPDQGLQTICT